MARYTTALHCRQWPEMAWYTTALHCCSCLRWPGIQPLSTVVSGLRWAGIQPLSIVIPGHWPEPISVGHHWPARPPVAGLGKCRPRVARPGKCRPQVAMPGKCRPPVARPGKRLRRPAIGFCQLAVFWASEGRKPGTVGPALDTSTVRPARRAGYSHGAAGTRQKAQPQPHKARGAAWGRAGRHSW